MSELNNNTEELVETEDVQTLTSEVESPLDETKKKKKPYFKYILSIGFMVILIAVTAIILFNKYSFSDLMDLIGQVNYWWIVLGILMIFIYIFFEGYAMKIIFRSMGQKVSFGKNIMYSSIDYYYCAITPSASGGQPMVAYYMAKDGVSLSYVSICLLINTALFKIVLVALGLVGLIMYPNLVVGSGLMLGLFIFGFTFNIFMIVMCFLGAFKTNWVRAFGLRLILFLHKIHIVKRPIKWVRTLYKKMDEYEVGAKLIKSHKLDFTKALLCNFIQRIALFSVTFIIFYAFRRGAMGDSIDYHSYWELMGIQVLIALAVDSLPLPGGVGISEYLYLLLFGFVYSGEEMIASAMLLTRAVSFYIPVIVCALISILEHVLVIRNDIKKQNLQP